MLQSLLKALDHRRLLAGDDYYLYIIVAQICTILQLGTSFILAVQPLKRL